MAASRPGTFALLLVSALVSLAFAEGALRLFTPFPITEGSNKRSHPRLGYVVDSSFPDIDARGFRNRDTTLDRAELAVVGDSHTYGYNVAFEESFPERLASDAGLRTYNLGVPSYGIYHYLVLLDELAAQPPREVMLALYPANDLVLHCSVTALAYWPEFERAAGVRAPLCPHGSDRRPQPPLFTKRWFETRTALGNVLLALVWDKLKPDASFRFPHEQQVSISRVEKHARAAALDREQIEQSFRNSLRILHDVNERFAAAGTRFSVLIIPSRERVLHDWARENGHPMQPDFENLLTKERQLTQAYLDFLRAEGIAHLDAIGPVLEAFAAEVDAGRRFYPEHDDAHPFAAGYAAYARAAAELLGHPGAP
jgi:hypothetical protein